MKKQVLMIALAGMLVLAGCGTETSNPQADLTGDQNLSITSTGMNTQQAIKDYLAAANADVQKVKVATGDNIIVDYIGRLDDHNVFDTSVESIAKASGKYNPNRDYEAGLEFTVGAGQMIAGFDAGVVGMKLGETKTLKIPADQAYGQKKDELIEKIPLEQVGDLSGVSVGTQVLLGGKIPATITEITDKDITVDANHELAGKDLIFDVTIKKITPAK